MIDLQLSVCLITYNHAAYIEEAIRSVLSQEHDLPWEFIISDDCSTDGTQEVIRKYAAQHPNLIQPILRDKNLGSWVHIVHLLGAAQGEFVAFLEGDDRYTDNRKLQIQVDYLRSHPECVGCFHDLSVVDEKGHLVHESFLASQGSDFRQFVEQQDLFNAGGIAQINSWVYRRSGLGNLPRWVVDFPLDKSLAFYLANFGGWGYIDRKMSLYRLHGGGIYSPLPMHHQNEMLLKHMLILYRVPEYRALYGRTLQLRICHYCRELAHAYRTTSHPQYFKYLLTYLRYHLNTITALKVLLAEEFLKRGARES